MFGYIKTHRPELKVGEDEVYKGVYCSVCRELGKRYGVMPRMFLTFDSAFLAVAFLSLSDNKLSFFQKRCPFNPTKKCNFCSQEREEIIYAADISVLLLYYKILDNIRDSTIIKAFLYRILLLIMKRAFKKAVAFRPNEAAVIEDCIKMQNEVEEKRSPLIDEAAEPTAIMLQKIYAVNESDPDEQRVRERIGYNIGRWVYLIDAFDDIEKDRKSGSYNPFIVSGRDNYEQIRGDLLMTAGEIASAFELLDTKCFRGIMENIIYDGLYYETQRVYERRLQNG